MVEVSYGPAGVGKAYKEACMIMARVEEDFSICRAKLSTVVNAEVIYMCTHTLKSRPWTLNPEASTLNPDVNIVGKSQAIVDPSFKRENNH